MSINACLYDADGVLAGCITDSAIELFQSEFAELKKKYFGDTVTPVLGVMEKSLIQSVDKKSADFLNCLKLLSRKYRDDAPVGFVQEASRVYHNLVRYCCSQAVYDEVLEETIAEFREAGLDYVGGNSRGFEQDDCIFEYKGRTVAVRMRSRPDLYRLWAAEGAGACVKVTDGADEYSECVEGSPADVAAETVRFIDEELDHSDDDSSLVEDIIDAIGMLLGQKD